jgi:hypothetical protein
VQEFAAAVGAAFATNLEARLNGRNLPKGRHLPLGMMIFRTVWRRLRAMLGIG